MTCSTGVRSGLQNCDGSVQFRGTSPCAHCGSSAGTSNAKRSGSNPGGRSPIFVSAGGSGGFATNEARKGSTPFWDATALVVGRTRTSEARAPGFESQQERCECGPPVGHLPHKQEIDGSTPSLASVTTQGATLVSYAKRQSGSSPHVTTPGWCSGSIQAFEASRAAFESRTWNHAPRPRWTTGPYKPAGRVQLAGGARRQRSWMVWLTDDC